jgi:hypothetical protein
LPNIHDHDLYRHPKPFKKSLFLLFKIRSSTQVTLQLFDLSGRIFHTPISNQDYHPGKYMKRTHAIDLNLQAGAYVAKLITKNDFVTTKAIFIE